MKRRNLLIIVFAFLFGNIFNMYIYSSEKDIKINREIKNKNDVSIMVYDADSQNYVKQNQVPIGAYELNEDASYCINDSLISNYNSETGTIKYTFKDVDECYVYFDKAQLEPKENVVSIKDLGYKEDLLSYSYNTKIEVPNDVTITYVDLSSAYSGKVDRYSDDFELWAESNLNKNYCQNSNNCVSVNSVSEAKFYMSTGNNINTESYMSYDNGVVFTYLNPYFGTWNYMVYAFRFEKESYMPSAWYYGVIYFFNGAT